MLSHSGLDQITDRPPVLRRLQIAFLSLFWTSGTTSDVSLKMSMLSTS
jgi:hypothetical protein